MFSKHINKLIAISLFVLSFLAYIFTLTPSLFWGDSPELAASAYTLGIAHPSGYPLYTLIGKIFTLIPVGTVAYRLNLMSAFFAALAVSVVYFIALKLAKSRTAGVLSALTFAFSYTFWSQATIAEVYTLNVFFIALLILLLLKWKENPEPKWLYAFSFLFGLGMTNHLSLILIFPACLYFIIANNNKKILHPRKLCIMTALFAAGLLIYLYLPLRALYNPIMNWGNPITFTALVEQITGVGYHHYFMPSSALLNLRFALYFLLLQFPLTLGFSMVTIFTKWKTEKISLIFLVLIAVFNIAYNICYSIHDIIVYYIPAYLILSIFIGIGIKATIDFLLRKVPKRRTYYTLLGIAFILIIANIIILFNQHNSTERTFNAADERYRPLIYPELFPRNVDRHNFNATDAYAAFVLNTAKPNALIIGKSDEAIFPLIYSQVVEGKRKDVIIIYSSLLTSAQWYVEQLSTRHPELNLRIVGTDGNLSMMFDVPSALYLIEKNPALTTEFNQSYMQEYVGLKTATLPLYSH